MADLSPEERADAIVDNLDIYQRSTTMTPKVMIAAHIREAVHSLEFEVAQLLRVDAERAKEVEHLQRRLAERRQAFRDVEHRAKTLAGARKAIQELGRKLRQVRSARLVALEVAAKFVEAEVASYLTTSKVALAKRRGASILANMIRGLALEDASSPEKPRE